MKNQIKIIGAMLIVSVAISNSTKGQSIQFSVLGNSLSITANEHIERFTQFRFDLLEYGEMIQFAVNTSSVLAAGESIQVDLPLSIAEVVSEPCLKYYDARNGEFITNCEVIAEPNGVEGKSLSLESRSTSPRILNCVIRGQDLTEKAFYVSVISISGQEQGVVSVERQNSEDEITFEIEMASPLSTGVYLIKAENAREKLTTKLLIE